MTAVLVAVHLLAATVWVGGSTALIFVGVPAIRILEGDARGRAMKELGLRWRPLGYGALLVAALTGVVLAVHNFVLGPRLQAEIRDGRDQVTRPALVVVGWVSYSLTLSLPLLGVALARIVG